MPKRGRLAIGLAKTNQGSPRRFKRLLVEEIEQSFRVPTCNGRLHDWR